MKKQATHRKYNFPDADLYLQCIERIRYAHRDIAQFEAYGYARQRLEKFLKACEAFKVLPNDD